MTTTAGKIAYPELTDLSSIDTLVINQYHGDIKGYTGQKNVIYTCFGENLAEPELEYALKKFANSFTIILSTRRYSKEYEQKFNCRFFYIPSAYSWYATQIPHVDINFERTFTKHFVSLNNRIQWNRQGLYQFLLNFNLKNKFYFSFHGHDRFKDPGVQVYNDTKNIIGNTWYNNRVEHDEAFRQLPITTGLDEFDTNDWTVGNRLYYETAFASVITETYIDENFNPFFTEKTMKPIAFGHPFLISSSAGALSKLRELGFYSFGSVIDESYDKIDNHQLRFEAMLKEVLRICQLDIDDVTKMYNHIKPQVIHNYQLFWSELSKTYQTDIADIKQQIKELL
jgi:hypothetical protein